MPLISGAASVTRFDVTSRPAEPDFAAHAFRAISPGSEVRESVGFVPFEPDADYRIGADRWAFRVRIDRLRPDPTAVRERLAELLLTERQEAGVEVVPPKRRRMLRNLAEEELLRQATARSVILEGVLEGRLLLLGSVANAQLDRAVQLLRRAGVLVEYKTPWNDLGQKQAESEILEIYDPFTSAHGSTFVKHLLGDPEMMLEPNDGYVRLQTREARVVLHGGVVRDVHRYIDEGAEILAAKLLTPTTSFRLDALRFRLSGLRLDAAPAGHWSERLGHRLDQIVDTWDVLDRKYAECFRLSGRARTRGGSASRDQSRTAADTAEAPAAAGTVIPFER